MNEYRIVLADLDARLARLDAERAELVTAIVAIKKITSVPTQPILPLNARGVAYDTTTALDVAEAVVSETVEPLAAGPVEQTTTPRRFGPSGASIMQAIQLSRYASAVRRRVQAVRELMLPPSTGTVRRGTGPTLPRDAMQWAPALGVLITTVLIVGICSVGNRAVPIAAQADAPLAGKFTASGSSGANPPMMALVTRFSQLHPSVSFTLTDIDTETSIVNVSTGDVDFGYIGREPLPSENKVGLTPIGFGGSVLAVHPVNPVTSLTRDQVAKIYAGQVIDWSELNSTAGPVKVFIREATSSTRTAVESYIYDATVPKYPAGVLEIPSSADTIKAIAAFKGAIGYVTLSSKNLKDPSIKLLGIDGVQPTLAILNGGQWKMSKPSFMTTNANPAKVKPVIKALADFIKSPEGQKIVSGE